MGKLVKPSRVGRLDGKLCPILPADYGQTGESTVAKKVANIEKEL